MFLVCCIVISSYLHIYGDAISLRENAEVPAVLTFGDSIVDTGNNNYIATVAKANFPPYGRDFEGGVPTGRFSNGKIPSDLFAEEFDVKGLVPPYLDPNLQLGDLLTGVSFASGGSGYDPVTAKIANVLSMDDQMKLFKAYINKLRTAVGENTTHTIISKSVYLICAGSNDIGVTYFSLLFRRLQYDVSSYTDVMVYWASTFIQELYSLGARRIGVMNALPCGCFPAQRTLFGGLLRKCVEKENQAAILYNNKLYSELISLNQRLAGSQVVYLDVYSSLLNLISNPYQYGFEVVDRGCCGTGNIEVTYLCKLAPLSCEDASKHIFWDSIHPTETAYRIIVYEVLHNSVF